MSRTGMLTLLLSITGGCAKDEPPKTPVEPPRPGVALVGAWHRIAPLRLAGDTLLLRADTTASGVIAWDEGRDMRVAHWSVRFGSRDSVAGRQDWREGHSDGGDPACFLSREPVGCISMPMLCLGAGQLRACNTFALIARDSLLLADGSRFVRAQPQASVIPARADR